MNKSGPHVFICECNGIAELWPPLIEAIYGKEEAEKVEVYYPLDLEELIQSAGKSVGLGGSFW